MRLFSIKQTHNFNWYSILWLSALIVVMYLIFTWHIDKKFLGIVERKQHLISAQEPGQIQIVLVTVGDKVKKDQILMMLDISDLHTNIAQLKEELANFQRLENANRDHYALLIQRVGLQLENEASDLIDRLSLIESKSTELKGLNSEIERLQNAEAAGLGYNRDLANLTIQRDALTSYLREQSKELELLEERLGKVRESRRSVENANVDSLTRVMLLDQMEHTESLRREITLTEHRIRLRTVVAPCEGYVTEVMARAGDVVDAFIPVINVEESKPSYLTLYLPEKSKIQPEVGMNVHIYSSRSRKYNTTGVITFVHPGFTTTSERLSFRGQIFWARRIQVELNRDHHLIPGEVVSARISNHIKRGDHLSIAAKVSVDDIIEADNSVDSYPTVKDMTVPKSMRKMTRFEPSGVSWMPNLNKFIIVSDDTGIQNSINDHAPYLFLMDENGKVDTEPVLLVGTDSVNDLEAITPASDVSFYLVSSQNISKKGNRPQNREMIYKVKYKNSRFQVENKIEFLSLLLGSYSTEDLMELGLEQLDKDGQPILNIEGAAFFDNALYLSLKEPVSEKGAILWKLNNVDNIFINKKLEKNQLSLFGYVQLGKYKDKNASFSDIIFDHNGILWALSTIAGAETQDQLGGFHRINRFANGRLEATRIYSFPGLKPEGICIQNHKRFLITFDKDAETPSYCYIDMEEL